MRKNFKLVVPAAKASIRLLLTPNSWLAAKKAKHFAWVVLMAEKANCLGVSREKFNPAFFQLEKLAIWGDREAQFLFAFLHSGVLKNFIDENIAYQMFALAAAQKHSLAEFHWNLMKRHTPWTKTKLVDSKEAKNTQLEYVFSADPCFDKDQQWLKTRRASVVHLNGFSHTLVDTKESGNYGAIRSLFGEAKNTLKTRYIVKSPFINGALRYEEWEREAYFFKKAYPNHFSALMTNSQSNPLDWRFIMPVLGQMDLIIALETAEDNVEILKIMLAFLDELDRLHALGIVHGDIRLENFRVTKIQAGYIVHAIDFGMAYNEGDAVKSALGSLRAQAIRRKVLQWQKESILLLKRENIAVSELKKMSASYIESAEWQEQEDSTLGGWVIAYDSLAPEMVAQDETYAACRTQDIYAYAYELMKIFPDYETHEQLKKLLEQCCLPEMHLRAATSQLRAELVRVIESNLVSAEHMALRRHK